MRRRRNVAVEDARGPWRHLAPGRVLRMEGAGEGQESPGGAIRPECLRRKPQCPVSPARCSQLRWELRD